MIIYLKWFYSNSNTLFDFCFSEHTANSEPDPEKLQEIEIKEPRYRDFVFFTKNISWKRLHTVKTALV